MLVTMILILVLKASYYLSLVESFSPLIDTIFKIVWGSKWFGFMIGSITLVFTFNFYFYGKNQVDFDLVFAQMKYCDYGNHPILQNGSRTPYSNDVKLDSEFGDIL